MILVNFHNILCSVDTIIISLTNFTYEKSLQSFLLAQALALPPAGFIAVLPHTASSGSFQWPRQSGASASGQECEDRSLGTKPLGLLKTIKKHWRPSHGVSDRVSGPSSETNVQGEQKPG